MSSVIGFVGAGNMGGSILCGAVSSGAVSKENILVNSLVSFNTFLFFMLSPSFNFII